MHTDGVGDTFSEKYGVYVKGDVSLIEDTLVQLEKNYEDSFDEKPSKKDMENALKFTSLFLAEIGETCAKSVISRDVSSISALVSCEKVVRTAENISFYRTDK